jgi:shikimate kinase
MIDSLIAITGFMASGKTTVGRALAARLNCAFVDLDEFITSEQKRTINEIIEADGEDGFRRLETTVLDKVLRENKPQIIALGGGTWARQENRSFLKVQNARVVWLDAPFELCWRRIQIGEDGRPLAPSREVAEKLYRARRSIYELAELRLVVSANKSPEEIAEKIAAAFLQGNSHS